MNHQPPDESLTSADAADELNMSERQVRRYLKTGKLRGSCETGRWKTTALDIWRFKGIDAEMLESWRRYCLENDVRRNRSDHASEDHQIYK